MTEAYIPEQEPDHTDWSHVDIPTLMAQVEEDQKLVAAEPWETRLIEAQVQLDTDATFEQIVDYAIEIHGLPDGEERGRVALLSLMKVTHARILRRKAMDELLNDRIPHEPETELQTIPPMDLDKVVVEAQSPRGRAAVQHVVRAYAEEKRNARIAKENAKPSPYRSWHIPRY